MWDATPNLSKTFSCGSPRSLGDSEYLIHFPVLVARAIRVAPARSRGMRSSSSASVAATSPILSRWPATNRDTGRPQARASSICSSRSLGGLHDVLKAEARPGGFVATGGHGGVLASLGDPRPPILTLAPAARHIYLSDVHLSSSNRRHLACQGRPTFHDRLRWSFLARREDSRRLNPARFHLQTCAVLDRELRGVTFAEACPSIRCTALMDAPAEMARSADVSRRSCGMRSGTPNRFT